MRSHVLISGGSADATSHLDPCQRALEHKWLERRATHIGGRCMSTSTRHAATSRHPALNSTNFLESDHLLREILYSILKGLRL